MSEEQSIEELMDEVASDLKSGDLDDGEASDAVISTKEADSTEDQESTEEAETEEEGAQEASGEQKESGKGEGDSTKIDVSPELVAIAEKRKNAFLEVKKARDELETHVASAVTEAKGEMAAMFRHDPVRFFKEIGLEGDPESKGRLFHNLAQQFYADALGDDAPDELKSAKRKWEAEQRVVELEKWKNEREAKDAERIAKESQEREISRFKESVKEELAGIGTVKDKSGKTLFPLLSRNAKRNPDKFANEVFSLSKTYHEETGEIPPLTDVYAYLEGELRELIGGDDATEETKPKTKKMRAKHTLSNEDSSPTKRPKEPESHEDRIEMVIQDLRRGISEEEAMS